MNVDQLRESGRIIFEVLTGSRAYGTHTPESDEDIRGIFAGSREPTLFDVPQQVSDKTNDITFFELKRFFELAANANPNVIELLFHDEKFIRHKHPAMDLMIQNRHLFISKKCYHSFSGYAYSQQKRAKGRNKWINNPQSKTPPKKEDFCWIINLLEDHVHDMFPLRPVPLKNTVFSLEELNAAKLEHSANMYRLYDNGNAKGVFRNGQLTVESIPKDEEWPTFIGLLIFNETEYDRKMKDWKNYHGWLKERNEARYRSQEAGEMDFDGKNMMHTMRLLWSGINILEHGEPIVTFTGDRLETLMGIRKGLYSYEDVISMSECGMRNLDAIKGDSGIPEKINKKKLDVLYKDMIGLLEK